MNVQSLRVGRANKAIDLPLEELFENSIETNTISELVAPCEIELTVVSKNDLIQKNAVHAASIVRPAVAPVGDIARMES
ncbi:hypothetical protein LN996_11430 [Arthrobacter sp. AK01]|uniref:hypothetical protein n=1 Tax=Micrococcaceae TaxID=1268 RepID=UPI001E5D7026|nr:MULTISPECIES: hypothetical protein [Micrococcaceae]MCD4851423.1 hypothetical protein [Arthrobacter sp. AK01]MCP1412315.1 hypothetical protein [Paenarthrobacter sp. A20]